MVLFPQHNEPIAICKCVYRSCCQRYQFRVANTEENICILLHLLQSKRKKSIAWTKRCVLPSFFVVWCRLVYFSSNTWCACLNHHREEWVSWLWQTQVKHREKETESKREKGIHTWMDLWSAVPPTSASLPSPPHPSPCHLLATVLLHPYSLPPRASTKFRAW
jgi:hypothetical protein